MSDIQLVKLGTLDPNQWVRLPAGDIGLIHDKINQPGYRKASIEVHGSRYPVRIVSLEAMVEHLPNHQP